MVAIVYSAINSTVYDTALNYQGVLKAMVDAHACAQINPASLHVVSALPLTGPTAQGYYRFLNTNEQSLELIRMIKRLISEPVLEKTSLTTLISFPWYYRCALKPANHPFYCDSTNPCNNRPFYATAIIQHGVIVKLHLESYFDYCEGGPYDARYFAAWPMGRCEEVILDGDVVTVGSFAVNNICVASNPLQAGHFLKAHPDTQTIFLNGAGCYYPYDARTLSQQEDFQAVTLIVGNPLGTDSGDKIGSGAVFGYQNGIAFYVTSPNNRYCFTQTITHLISFEHPLNLLDKTDVQHDMIKAQALWLRDYWLKTKQQGLVISMSDAMNSAYSLLIANYSIDWTIQVYGENVVAGIIAYFDADKFGYLTCKNDVLQCLAAQGAQQALRLLKKSVLTCVVYEGVVCQSTKTLIEAVGAAVHYFDVEPLIIANRLALKQALFCEFNQPEMIVSATQRACVIQAGIVSNLENKISLSNASATDVGLGLLHAGGRGQEGPISVTLSLFQTQIYELLKTISNRSPHAIAQPIDAIVDDYDAGFIKYELIITWLIKRKYSAMATFLQLKQHGFEHWDHDTLSLLKDIDDICRVWSITQPSRVALSIAPYLGSYGNNLDRYRSVRNTRDNHYFHNGRVELKLFYLQLYDKERVTIACACATLKQYLLNTAYDDLNRQHFLELVKTHSPSPLVVNTAVQPLACHEMHVGTASLHQTMFDYSRNSQHIKQVIQLAETKGLDLLLLPELCLTGYFGDGDFDWINTQEEGDKIINQALHIAAYAKHSPLIISIGLPVVVPGYEKPLVGQALLQYGKIITISFKMTQPDGNAEYEAMHFSASLIDKSVVSVIDRRGHERFIYHEQCAEGWVGVSDNGTINDAIQQTQRYLNTIAPKYPGLLVLNPSGSKCDVRYDKAAVRRNGLGLTALNHHPTIAAYLYANVAGDDNGVVMADGDQYIMSRSAEGTLALHQGARYDLGAWTLNDGVILVHKKPCYYQLPPIPYDNSSKRRYTEMSYASGAWILNTLRHHQKQCFIISLSGGADSSFGVIQIKTAIDLFIQQHMKHVSQHHPEAAKQAALIALFDYYFSHLNCKQVILDRMSQDGADIAIQLLKQHILVCVYMPTNNSSNDTLLSSKALMQDGQLLVCPIQAALEASILSYTGRSDDFNEKINTHDITQALHRQVQDWPDELSGISGNEALFERIVIFYSEKKIVDKQRLPLCVFPQDLRGLLRNDPLTWWNPSHDLAKQNLQARLRSIIPWCLATLYDGLPLYTSNLSEAAVGYSTWAGDTSLGYENSLGGIFKSDIQAMLLLYEQGQLCDLPPIPGLFNVNHLQPSAELRPLDEAGAYRQTDEKDLMPYDVLDAIVSTMILEHQTPWQTYERLRHHPAFDNHESLVSNIKKVCHLYQSSQFKRTGGGNSPFFGSNLDPHVSEATTLISKRLIFP